MSHICSIVFASRRRSKPVHSLRLLDRHAALAMTAMCVTINESLLSFGRRY
jgi:hypothetical protein